MRRDSSISRSSGVLTLSIACAAVLASTGTAAARPWPCLPPLFDGGTRTHEFPVPSVVSLDLSLRQHEICWREPASPDELRVAWIGSSIAYGSFLPADQTAPHRLNQRFASLGVPARIYNLGFVYTHQVREAFVVHEALRYEPDVIVFALSLSGFVHVLPKGPYYEEFFISNRGIAQDFLRNPPPGLTGVFDENRGFFLPVGPIRGMGAQLRQVGAFVRAAVRNSAEAAAVLLGSPPVPPSVPLPTQPLAYPCGETLSDNTDQYRDWKQWNILAYLEQIQRTRGVEMLVVGLPVIHMPRGECYNVRYSKALFADFKAWAASETAARGLRYLDLHDRVPASGFFDSIHLNADGQEVVAEEIARTLGPMLVEKARSHERFGTGL